MPRFSVIVPTRDRPDLLDFALESLAGQTLDDVEVIVSDNPLERPSAHVFERWERPGWRYLRAEKPLTMHDNWERALASATGDYVTVLIDKTVLHPSALELAERAATADPRLDVITWWNEGYTPLDEAGNLGRGWCIPTTGTRPAELYDPRAELDYAFASETRRGSDPIHYFRGKIVFGAYSRRLIETVRARTGRVFHPISPDYTSRIAALAFGTRLLDLGRPLLVSYNSARSNGRQAASSPAYARRFIEETAPAALEALPIPGLYASAHNLVAYDLVASAARCLPESLPELDLVNLVRRAREDLEAVGWPDPAEEADQYAILEAAEARLDITPAPPPPEPALPRPSARGVVYELLTRVPPAERLLARRQPPPEPLPWDAPEVNFDSPVDAARASDRFYTARAVDSRAGA